MIALLSRNFSILQLLKKVFSPSCYFFCSLGESNSYMCRYHSESGWQTLIEVIVEHYGLEVDQAAITIFICFVPVVIDACVKLWVCCPSIVHLFILFLCINNFIFIETNLAFLELLQLLFHQNLVG